MSCWIHIIPAALQIVSVKTNNLIDSPWRNGFIGLYGFRSNAVTMATGFTISKMFLNLSLALCVIWGGLLASHSIAGEASSQYGISHAVVPDLSTETDLDCHEKMVGGQHSQHPVDADSKERCYSMCASALIVESQSIAKPHLEKSMHIERMAPYLGEPTALPLRPPRA